MIPLPRRMMFRNTMQVIIARLENSPIFRWGMHVILYMTFKAQPQPNSPPLLEYVARKYLTHDS